VGESALRLSIADAAGTEGLGAAVAAAVGERGLLVGLEGDLGTGKTTFARGFLRRLGITGSIRSPTYTLIEPYDAGGRVAYHLDLYRLVDPQELELIGIRDLLRGTALVLVEWPERAGRVLPRPDFTLRFEHAPGGRTVTLQASSGAGKSVLSRLRVPEHWHMPD
jgi:tRNA threonylcarbamoyladenosine biosynthesis protein TsaE